MLIYWIALRLGLRRGPAAVAALLFAIWPAEIVVSKRPMLDTWAGFFTIWCLAVFILARDSGRERRWLILLGLLTGIGIYFRPFLFFLPIALALLATPQGGWRRRVVWAAVPSLVALCVLAPWTIRNYAEFHRFIPTRAGLGYALYLGIGKASSDAEATKAAYAIWDRSGSDCALLEAAILCGIYGDLVGLATSDEEGPRIEFIDPGICSPVFDEFTPRDMRLASATKPASLKLSANALRMMATRSAGTPGGIK